MLSPGGLVLQLPPGASAAAIAASKRVFRQSMIQAAAAEDKENAAAAAAAAKPGRKKALPLPPGMAAVASFGGNSNADRSGGGSRTELPLPAGILSFTLTDAPVSPDRGDGGGGGGGGSGLVELALPPGLGDLTPAGVRTELTVPAGLISMTGDGNGNGGGGGAVADGPRTPERKPNATGGGGSATSNSSTPSGGTPGTPGTPGPNGTPKKLSRFASMLRKTKEKQDKNAAFAAMDLGDISPKSIRLFLILRFFWGVGGVVTLLLCPIYADVRNYDDVIAFFRRYCR